MLLKNYLEDQNFAIFGGYIDIFMGDIKKKGWSKLYFSSNAQPKNSNLELALIQVLKCLKDLKGFQRFYQLIKI